MTKPGGSQVSERDRLITNASVRAGLFSIDVIAFANVQTLCSLISMYARVSLLSMTKD